MKLMNPGLLSTCLLYLLLSLTPVLAGQFVVLVEDAGVLEVDDSIQWRGRKIGTIESIQNKPNQVHIQIQVAPRYDLLPDSDIICRVNNSKRCLEVFGTINGTESLSSNHGNSDQTGQELNKDTMSSKDATQEEGLIQIGDVSKWFDHFRPLSPKALLISGFMFIMIVGLLTLLLKKMVKTFVCGLRVVFSLCAILIFLFVLAYYYNGWNIFREKYTTTALELKISDLADQIFQTEETRVFWEDNLRPVLNEAIDKLNFEEKRVTPENLQTAVNKTLDEQIEKQRENGNLDHVDSIIALQGELLQLIHNLHDLPVWIHKLNKTNNSNPSTDSNSEEISS